MSTGTSEAKEQWKQWTSPGECAPKNAKTAISARKATIIVFWDSQGMISQSSTMPNYCTDSTPNCKKGPICRRKMCFFTMTTQIGRIGLRIATPSTVFSRIGPVRFFLFPNFPNSLAGQKFELNEMIVAMETYFADLEKTYFSDGLKK